MVDVPERLARSLRTGRCVLWVGAGIGRLADRPGWPELLGAALAEADPKDRADLEDLLARGRLRPVFDVLRSSHADVLERHLSLGGGEAEVDGAARLANVRWAACLTLAFPEVVRRALGDRTIVRDAGALTPESSVLHARPDVDLRELVDELAPDRPVVALGFDAGDPDLESVLEAMASGHERYAMVAGLSAPERRALSERYGVEVIAAGENWSDTIAAVVAAADKVEGDGSERPAERAALDLARLVADVPARADVGHDAALAVDPQEVERLLQERGSEALSGNTWTRVGTVLLAHDRRDAARTAYGEAASGTSEIAAVARFGLAWVDFADGKHDDARAGLAEAARRRPSLALAGDEITEIVGRVAARTILRVRRDGAVLELEVHAFARTLARRECDAFVDAIGKLSGKTGWAGLRTGRAHARRLVLERDPVEGQTLAARLRHGKLSLDETLGFVDGAAAALAALHQAGLAHGSLDAHALVLHDGAVIVRDAGVGAVPSSRVLRAGVAAPEIAAGGRPSAAGDAYALAALVVQALSGVAPSVAVPPSSLMPDVDARVDAAVAACLHPDATKRAPVASLAEALHAISRSPVVQPVGEAAPSTSIQIQTPNDPDDLEAWAWILDRKPTHGEARDNVARIEREARYADRWDRVAEVLGVRAQHTQVQSDRVGILRELAHVYEQKLGAPVNAFETTRSLVEEVTVAEQLDLVPELARLAEVTGKWGPFADSLMIVAERVTDIEPQADLYERLAGVFSERLGATDRAIAAWEKASQLRRSAAGLGALARLYRKAGHHAELAATLLSRADLQQGDDRVSSLLDAASVLQDDLGDVEGGFAALHAALDDAPQHPVALERAEPLARQLESWEELYTILDRRAKAGIDAAEISERRHEAASVATDHLDDPSRAIDQYEKLVDHDRADEKAAARLVELLRVAASKDPGQRVRLIDALDALAERVDTADEKVELLRERAELLDQEPDGKERAADTRVGILDTVSLERAVARDALTALERWYRRQEDHPRLIALLERAGRAEDADEAFRVDAWDKLLTLRVSGPNADGIEAITALEALTTLQPHEKKWRDELLHRYLEREEYAKAGPLIRAQVFDEPDPKRKAQLLLKGGKLREQIGKIEGAVEAFEEAVELDPSLWQAWLHLRDLYRQVDRPLKAIEAQVAAAKMHVTRGERVRLTFDAARMYLNELDKPDRGLELLETLVELDPDHREGTGILVERLIASGQGTRAWPHAQTWVMQVRSQAPDDKPLNVHALSVAGRCALSVGEKERAREYLEKARNFDATNLDVLQFLADLDMDAERYADALRNYQSVVLGLGSKMPANELSRVYVRMGQARVGMGEKPKAVQMAERALEIDPDNEAAVEALIELAPDVGGAVALVKAKQRLDDMLARRIQRLEDNPSAREVVLAERVALLQSIAKIQTDELKSGLEAVRTLEILLDLKPGDLGLLHQLLDVFTRAERWLDATRVLGRLAAAQADPKVKAKYLYAGGAIFRDHLADHDTALKWMRSVIEFDPDHDRGFKAAIELLERAKSWKELSRLYRVRLKALPEDATAVKERIDLLVRLGDIYEEKLSDSKTALAAYNQALKLAPPEMQNDPVIVERRERVMRLAVALGDDEIDKAIGQCHSKILNEPSDFETYHRLVELYLRAGDKDRARALARTLVFLKQSDEAEDDLAKQTGGGAGLARGMLSRDLWRKNVHHPLENRRISDILSLVWPVVAAREGHGLAHHGIKSSDRSDPSLQSPQGLARFVAHACQVLDTPVPEMYLRAEDAGDIAVDALCFGEGGGRKVVPTLIAAKTALADSNEAAMRFRAGRAVARLRPEHILSGVLPSATNIRNVVYGAVAATSNAAIPADAEAEAKRYGDLYRKYLQPAVLEQLGSVAAKLVAKGEVDVRGWLQGTACTVTRAGFVVADSLDVAGRILMQEGDAGWAASSKARLRDLIAYSVSEPYLRLRRELGFGR